MMLKLNGRATCDKTSASQEFVRATTTCWSDSEALLECEEDRRQL
jgi:hypothetical protein